MPGGSVRFPDNFSRPGSRPLNGQGLLTARAWVKDPQRRPGMVWPEPLVDCGWMAFAGQNEYGSSGNLSTYLIVELSSGRVGLAKAVGVKDRFFDRGFGIPRVYSLMT